jgi:hypothetical protein
MSPRTKPQSNKTSDLPVGVSIFVERGRKPGSSPWITFGVVYKTPAGRSVKKFRTSVNADEREIDHARESAVAFRECYVHCVESGIEFNPEPFSQWRMRKLYPFRPKKN